MIRRVLDSRAVWLLLGAALCWSLCRMGLRQLGKDPRFLAWPREVHAAAPPWGGPELIEPVRRQLRRLGPVSLFDPRFAGRIRDALEEVAVVRTVGEVRRRWPNRYSVSLALHRPVAVVLFEGREVLVAEDRTVLPSGPYASAATGLLRIHGVRAPPAAPGRPWRSERLDRGLATLAQIADVRDRDLLPLGISELDVSGALDPFAGVLLIGADGVLVRWGRPAADVGENSVEKKIGYLRIAARHVDQVRGREIDVRFDELYVRETAVP